MREGGGETEGWRGRERKREGKGDGESGGGREWGRKRQRKGEGLEISDRL